MVAGPSLAARFARAGIGLVVVLAGCWWMAASALAGTPGNLFRFAGNGNPGSPTPGPALSSSFMFPKGMAMDSSGDVYVADWFGNRVEKITPDGTLSIIAGTGNSGAPTVGPATSSRLNMPIAVAADATGDVFIADSMNNVIEKVTPSGALSIAAGTGSPGVPVSGQATSSPLSDPQGVAVDTAGDLYIADGQNNVVEKVTPSGTLSIIAGNGTNGGPTPGPATSSHLSNPTGLAVDSSGDLYIADEGTSDVVKVTPSGTLSVVAGTGSPGMPTPGPATSSPLHAPVGVAVDNAGNAYITDEYIDEILKVTPQGALSVYAGNGSGVNGTPTYGGPATSSNLNYPWGISVDGAGNVFFVQFSSNAVDEIFGPAPASTQLPSISGSPVLGQTLSADTGSWSPTPSTYAYQWRDCDSAGTNCADIAGATSASYTLTTSQVGQTVRVAVTASTVNGSATVTSLVSAVVTAATTTTSAATTAVPTTTTTSAATSTTTTDGATDGVTLSARADQAGVAVSGTGAVQLPLACPHTAAGCDADGLLTLALSGSHPHEEAADVAKAASSSVLARFAGVQIQTGHSRLVSVKLTPQATRYLQTRGVRRVRVTLTIHNHLSGGPDVITRQRVWLKIAGLRASCPSAIGTLTGAGIGQMRLGLTPSQAHHLGHHRKAGFGFARYCLASGAIRVKDPAHKLLVRLSARQRHQHTGRIYLALTANKHYAAGHVHTGMHVSAARARLRLGTGLTVGKNTWYLIVTKHAAWVLKAQHGTIREIGITTRSLTRTPQDRKLLLHNL